uniref:Putative plant transposon protein domain-containing protein n=1 Tax=Solanum tuberosum TaxID=4113 RepID=M1DNP1_SOLTU
MINVEVVAFWAPVSKLPPKGGKGKDKNHVQPAQAERISDSEDVYSTHLTSSKGEDHSEGSSLASFSEPEDDQLMQARRAKLCSKSMNDLSRIPVPPTPLPPPAPTQVAVQVPPVQVHPPWLLNRLKAEGLRTILEETRLSTDGVVDCYPEVWSTLKFYQFEIFTKPRGPYIPTWFWEFYSAYGELVPKGKKKANAFKTIDHVMLWGRKVKCSSSDINEILKCSREFKHYYVDKVQKKTLDDLKS